MAASGQQASLQGIVTSSETEAPLEGVGIVLTRGEVAAHRTITDRNGFYQIGGIEPGVYSLLAQHIGYLEDEQSLSLSPGGRLTVGIVLDPRAVAVEGVVVSAQQGATVRQLGRQRVTPADLHLVPVPGGSGDLASYLQTLPGVATTGDRGGQLFVRGGTASANLVLVDGIPIYQPFHILGFFSVFPASLVSTVDFYAGGFGARYDGRTSSVIDVGLRDGNPNEYRAAASVSPFIAEALVEGPAGEGWSWLASVRRSLVAETSEALLGTRQPLAFDSELFKLTATGGDDLRCSALGLRTSDRGGLDPDDPLSHVAWQNRLIGGRCVNQFESFLRLLEVNFSYSAFENSAVSRGSSDFSSDVWRVQHDAHVTTLMRSVPLYAGYHTYTEAVTHDLEELYGSTKAGSDALLGVSAYAEASLTFGQTAEVRPGLVATIAPRPGLEPRLRASWDPFGPSRGTLQAAIGLYRQDLIGTSDMRDVGSVFTAWMRSPEGVPVQAVHAMAGWQQALGSGLQWSVEGYYKRLADIPVPVWRAVAQFTTRLGRADGEVYGADGRLEYSHGGFYGYLGYGYATTRYVASQAQFGEWFGEAVVSYHPPHDRRHQLNALANLDFRGFNLSARWQFGTGLPFTQPLGFDEAFDYSRDFYDVSGYTGATRLILDRPFTARLPATHRLDVALQRAVDLPLGRLTAQLGVINAYDRRNMFYYDLYAGRRVDQLPLAPYASLTFHSQ